MRLLCIKGAKIGTQALNGQLVKRGQEIYEGEYYTKEGEFTDGDGTWFFLAERDGFSSYNANRFMPVSDVDETEMVREYNVVTQ